MECIIRFHGMYGTYTFSCNVWYLFRECMVSFHGMNGQFSWKGVFKIDFIFSRTSCSVIISFHGTEIKFSCNGFQPFCPFTKLMLPYI